MLKWIVILVLGLALLSGASPWPASSFVLHAPGFAWDGGIFSGILALAGIGIALLTVGLTLALVIGSALLLAVGLPVLIILGVLVVVFAPILLPFIILAALVGAVVKGLAVCAA